MFRKKTSEIILYSVCALMTLIALSLLSLSLIFSVGKGSPSIFGKSAYLVKTDAFEIIKNPSVVTAVKTEPANIDAGNIVIFTLENGAKAIGEARGVTSENGVAYFTVYDENGKEHVIADSSVVAKAVKTSAFLGVIVSFATSPAGMLIIVILPCSVIIAIEAVKPLLLRNRITEKIEPVNKQDETPTFVPNNPNITPEPKPVNPAAQPKLFTAEDKGKLRPVKPAPSSDIPSSVKLAQTISLVKSEKNGEVNNKEAKPSPIKPVKTKSIEEILAIYAGKTGKEGK